MTIEEAAKDYDRVTVKACPVCREWKAKLESAPRPFVPPDAEYLDQMLEQGDTN